MQQVREVTDHLPPAMYSCTRKALSPDFPADLNATMFLRNEDFPSLATLVTRDLQMRSRPREPTRRTQTPTCVIFFAARQLPCQITQRLRRCFASSIS